LGWEAARTLPWERMTEAVTLTVDSRAQTFVARPLRPRSLLFAFFQIPPGAFVAWPWRDDFGTSSNEKD